MSTNSNIGGGVPAQQIVAAHNMSQLDNSQERVMLWSQLHNGGRVTTEIDRAKSDSSNIGGNGNIIQQVNKEMQM
jgi:hypothetical protein